MNLIFINHNSLNSNSGIHISNLANILAEWGHAIAVVVPTREYDFSGRSRFELLDFGEVELYRFADGRSADLIHSWTPRQHVADITRRASVAHRCAYLVHLEDNELEITSAFTGLSLKELRRRSLSEPTLVPKYLSEPFDMETFIHGAAGITVLTGTLKDFVPARMPCLEFWPAAEDFFRPQAPDGKLRSKLRIPNDAVVVVYHGNVHPVNVAEVRSLYIAVAALARTGHSIRLVRLGTDYSPLFEETLPDVEEILIQVPFQPREAIPRFLALADFFVQPGRSDAFNDYRFPSKLPEFFAMGRPVILPAANVGLEAKSEIEALLLQRGDAFEIAGAMQRLISDSALSNKLALGARIFYNRALDWHKSAESLMRFYSGALRTVRLDDLNDVASLERAAVLYSDYRPVSGLEYATVRDYSDNVESLAALSTINKDLKDAQRPWVFKTLLGCVKRGGKLLEIGAGDPWVADLLARLGYEVTVIDPYDGRDLGPDKFVDIRARYPGINFVRGVFPDSLPASMFGFDCIYSISVLEHLSREAIVEVFKSIASKSKKGAVTIHAVDHVILGSGDADHLQKLNLIVKCLGFDEAALDQMLERLDRDPDAYFLSAEAHNLWRGSIAYGEFPMRRCVSIQIYAPATPL